MKKFSIYPAELNKEILNDSKLGGEIKVYNELKKNNLPGFSVFYSCWWHNETAKEIKDSKDGETDFILAHPNHGILFIEVKGGVIRHDGINYFSKDKNNIEYEISNPFRQVSKNKYQTMELLKRYYFQHLKKELPYINMNHAVIFPDSSNTHEFLKADSQEITLFAEDLPELFVKLLKILMPKNVSTRYGFIGEEGVEILKKMFFNDFKLEKKLSTTLNENKRIIDDLTTNQNKILINLENFKKLSICGGAGTGKTSLLIEKAISLHSKNKNVLILCYNKPLKVYLNNLLNDYKHIEVQNFDSFALKYNLEKDDKSNTYIIKKDVNFDSILVDEAQDFEISWLEILPYLFKDYDAGDFYIFYDDNQKIYKNALKIIPETLEKIDGTKWKSYKLFENLRNCYDIFKFNNHFYDGENIQSNGPWGEKIQFNIAANQKENTKKIGNTLHRLVNIEGIEKNRITIISATSLEKSSLKHEMKIGNFVIKNSEFLNLDFITFDSVFRFKGLENDVVILTDIDEVTNINEIMYVATSRARLLLIIISNETVINNLKHYI